MKKSFLKPLVAVSVLGAMFAASCSKSDSGKTRREMLVGNYYIYQTGNDSNANGAFDMSEKVTTVAGVDRDTILFMADGTGTTKMSGFNIAFTWALQDNDNNIKITVPNLDTVTAGIISVSETSVTVVDDITETGTNKSFSTFNKY